MSMRKILFTVISVCILLSGCTVTETLTLSNDESASVTDISVEQFFIDVLTDFQEFMPSGDENIMDKAITSFAGQIEDTDNAYGTLFVKSGENEYTGTFNFGNIAVLANELGGIEQSIITQTDNSLSFYCDIDNYTELEAVVPFLADPNVSVYLANYNVGYSEQDYYDMMIFAIGEQAPEAISGSTITFDITVPGRITSVEGAVQTGENTIRYSFPLIDFLLLSSPLSFSVQWV